MTSLPAFEPRGILRALCEHGVAFIVIGGFACEIHKVGNSTGDIDIIIDTGRDNAAALVAALTAIHARHAMPPGSQQLILPSVDRVQAATGDLHYDTDFGRLDVSKESGGHSYASLRAGGVFAATLHGHDILIADLRTIADMKTRAGRDKDRRMLPAIHQRLREMELADEDSNP